MKGLDDEYRLKISYGDGEGSSSAKFQATMR